MIELKATDLHRITCQLTLFNRQRFKLYNGTTERIVYDFSGRNLLINPVSFETEQDMERFFRQVKLIYFDGKVVGYRGCSELPLKLECRAFQK
ncbi:TPA: type III secretion system protein PrgR, partial [Enterococcus faecalis]|nr:type III secretion system protein PrgR [Enterococcus faecalis]